MLRSFSHLTTGTAVHFYGKASCLYAVVLDSQPVSVPLGLPDGLLFYQDQLTATTHSIQVVAQPESNSMQQLAFDQAAFTNTIDQSYILCCRPYDLFPRTNSTNGLIPIKYDNTNSTLQYNGSWSAESASWAPSPSNPESYMETNVSLASVSLSFTGGIAVSISAPRNWGHWTYNVVRLFLLHKPIMSHVRQALDDAVSSYSASTLWVSGMPPCFTKMDWILRSSIPFSWSIPATSRTISCPLITSQFMH
jgi:hypothetical protein